MQKEKLEIKTGIKVGRLTIGDLVRFVQDHELFVETPQSYLQQGKLRECYCDCGVIRLIAESILATGRIKSCGCLRQEIRSQAANGKVNRLQTKALKQSLTAQIKIEQARLKMLQLQPIPIRDEKALKECAFRIRSLIQQKATLNRKESHKETWKRTISG